jgi:hypothetical protein
MVYLQAFFNVAILQWCHGGATLKTLFLWNKLNDGKHSNVLVFQYSGQTSPLSL